MLKIVGIIIVVVITVIIYSLIAILGEKRTCCNKGYEGNCDGEKPYT
jgi:hypothetical protein